MGMARWWDREEKWRPVAECASNLVSCEKWGEEMKGRHWNEVRYGWWTGGDHREQELWPEACNTVAPTVGGGIESGRDWAGEVYRLGWGGRKRKWRLVGCKEFWAEIRFGLWWEIEKVFEFLAAAFEFETKVWIQIKSIFKFKQG
jgi:hypothetical protein